MKSRFCITVLATVLAVVGPGSSAQFKPEKYGIGATITRADTTSPFIIRSCTPGGPAGRAGLLPGDHIIEVDGKPVQTWSFEELLAYLIHDEPVPLRMTVLRDSTTFSVELLRARFSDMAAGQGFRWVPTKDSLNYTMVPLEERDTLAVGSVLAPQDLRDTRCEEREVRFDGERETLVYFWASWCGPCKYLIKELNKSRGRPAESGMRLVGVNVDGSCEVFAAVNDSIRAPGEQFWVGGYYGDLAQTFRIYRRGIPTGALFNRSGQLVAVKTGVDCVLALVDSTAAARVKKRQTGNPD